MAGPFASQFACEFGYPEFYKQVVSQALLMEDKTRDEETGLLYHGWDALKVKPWADPVTGRAPEFWDAPWAGCRWHCLTIWITYLKTRRDVRK